MAPVDVADLYREHARSVMAFACYHVGRQLAEDVTSETFAVAVRRRADIPTAALPWLLVVARTVGMAMARRAPDWSSLDDLSDSGLEDPGLNEIVERDDVIRTLKTLAPAERETLVLSAWFDLTLAQAALIVGCRPATFAVRLHRARRHFTSAYSSLHEPESSGHILLERTPNA